MLLTAVFFAESIIPKGAVDTAQDLQILLLVVSAFTTAVVGTVIPLLVAFRKLIVGPTERRIEAIDGRVEAIEKASEIARQEIREAREEDRAARQRVELRQAQIGGALGLDFND